MSGSVWPRGFRRVPDDPWVSRPVEKLALGYDTVEQHGWYSNLDHTVDQVGDYARRGDVLVDYSGGTGILARRLLDRLRSRPVGIVIVDSSPKFLRLALEKLVDEPRVAFRHIRFLKEERRLESVQDVLGDALLERGVDGIISTNAIHLYFRLEETVRSWRAALRDSGRVFIQSGNIRSPEMPDDEWIIDETVEVIHQTALEIVAEDEEFAAYRDLADKTGYMAAHDELRHKYFLPVRPLEYYLDVLRGTGFEIVSTRRRRIPAVVDEWCEFLKVYHEGVLGWVGGAEKVTGRPASHEVVRDRQRLMRRALSRIFGDAFEFGASWTYITCEPRS